MKRAWNRIFWASLHLYASQTLDKAIGLLLGALVYVCQSVTVSAILTSLVAECTTPTLWEHYLQATVMAPCQTHRDKSEAEVV